MSDAPNHEEAKQYLPLVRFITEDVFYSNKDRAERALHYRGYDCTFTFEQAREYAEKWARHRYQTIPLDRSSVSESIVHASHCWIFNMCDFVPPEYRQGIVVTKKGNGYSCICPEDLTPADQKLYGDFWSWYAIVKNE